MSNFNEQIEQLRPYRDALHNRHNGYKYTDLGFARPDSPDQALDQLIEEANDLGRRESEILMRDTIEQLRLIIVRYADHHRDCAVTVSRMGPLLGEEVEPRCTCGFDDAIKGAAK